MSHYILRKTNSRLGRQKFPIRRTTGIGAQASDLARFFAPLRDWRDGNSKKFPAIFPSNGKSARLVSAARRGDSGVVNRWSRHDERSAAETFRLGPRGRGAGCRGGECRTRPL